MTAAHINDTITFATCVLISRVVWTNNAINGINGISSLLFVFLYRDQHGGYQNSHQYYTDIQDWQQQAALIETQHQKCVVSRFEVPLV